MNKKPVTLTIQRWGNSLAVRIPATIAKKAHFEQGSSVEIILQDGAITFKHVGQNFLTLDERLKRFDPIKHGGEVMVEELIGQERF